MRLYSKRLHWFRTVPRPTRHIKISLAVSSCTDRHLNSGYLLMNIGIDIYIINMYSLWACLNTESSKYSIPVGLCGIGPRMRTMNTRWHRTKTIVNTYLYLMLSCRQFWQPIAMWGIEMVKMADTVSINPQRARLGSFHDKFQPLIGKPCRNIDDARISYLTHVWIQTCERRGHIGRMLSLAELVLIGGSWQTAFSKTALPNARKINTLTPNDLHLACLIARY